MRFVVIGAGAVGGTIAGRLHQSGADTVLVARGANLTALASQGLTLQSPTSNDQIPVPVSALEDLTWSDHDVVVLAVKGQDSDVLLTQIAQLAPLSIAVVCAQNGVDNERQVLRRFEHTYGMCVLCPSAYLEPGVVQVYSSPNAGVFDLGRWPNGTDATSDAIAEAFDRATLRALSRPDIQTMKYGKLMSNLMNAVEALCAPGTGRTLGRLVRDEAIAVLSAHGIDVAAGEAAITERHTLVNYQGIDGADRGGGSSWQSLARQTGSIETDFLNGEITLLGRLVGLPTPANALLQLAARDASARGLAPGSVSEDDLLARIAD